jgi:hypothetical protein
MSRKPAQRAKIAEERLERLWKYGNILLKHEREKRDRDLHWMGLPDVEIAEELQGQLFLFSQWLDSMYKDESASVWCTRLLRATQENMYEGRIQIAGELARLSRRRSFRVADRLFSGGLTKFKDLLLEVPPLW